MHTMGDSELIQAYVRDRSEAAFTELVHRHLGVVYSVALRRVGDTLLAGDIAQSVFVLLARKAATFRDGALLAGWLFRTTGFVAARALRAELRRKRREETASAMNSASLSPDQTDALWDALAPHLDEAVASLSEADRAVVLLRFYERKPLREVGARIGLNEEAAKKRLQRAVEKLRGFFMRRGLTLGGAALAAVLAEKTVEAAPPALVSAVVKAGLAGGAAAAGMLPPLAQEALRAWRWARVRFALGLTGLALLGLFSARTFPWGSTHSANPVARPAPEAPAGLANGSPTAPAAATRRPAAGAVSELLLGVKDALTSTNVPRAGIQVNYLEGRKWWQRYDLVTDEDGLCRVPLPPNGLARLDVGVSMNGFVQCHATWMSLEDDPIPATYTLKLQRAVPIGGSVRDPEDRPVAGAEITLRFEGPARAPTEERPRERLGPIGTAVPVVARTDAAGRWECCVTPPELAILTVAAKHPQYAEARLHVSGPGLQTADGKAVGYDAFRAGQAVIRFENLYPLEGLVTDQDGRPLAGATVQAGEWGGLPEATQTNTDVAGRFWFSRLEPGKRLISAFADGYAVAQSNVQVGLRTPAIRFQLQPAQPWRIRVVDEDGQPLPGAWVCLESWPLVRHSVEMRRWTDAEGRLEWRSAPPGQLEFYVFKPGYCESRGLILPAGGQEHVVSLESVSTLTGHVTDAATGEPIPFFRVFPNYPANTSGIGVLERRFGTNGLFHTQFRARGAPLICFDAEDYVPTQERVTLLSPHEGVCDARLRRWGSNEVIEGTVLRTDGGPAPGVPVALATLQHLVVLRGNRFDCRRNPRNESLLYRPDYFTTSSDAQGRFRFRRLPGAHTVAAADASGVGSVSCATPGQVLRLQLQPWGRIEGLVRLTGQNWAGRKLYLRNWGRQEDSGAFYCDLRRFSTNSDEQGRFSFEDVPPGVYCLQIDTDPGRLGRDYAGVEVRAGEVNRVQFGGTGRVVTGRFLAPPGRSVADWSQQLSSPALATESPPTKPPAGLTPDDLARWRLASWQSNVALCRSACNCSVQVRPDGAFAVFDVPPGTYELSAGVPGRSRAEPSLHCSRPAIRIESGDPTMPVELGEVTLKTLP